MIAFLTHVEELAGEPARWLHLGMTSSDVLDAALAIQLVEAADRDPGRARPAARRAAAGAPTSTAPRRRSAARTASTPSRSPPGWCSPASTPSSGARAAALVAAREEIAVGKIAGAVGTYANLDPGDRGARRWRALGLRPRDGPHADRRARSPRRATSRRWRALGTAVERIALTVRHWQRTEVGEATEAFGKGQKGSSAMPHKKNPILSENLCGLARLLRSLRSRPRWRTSRSGTSATSRTRRSSA